MSPSLLLLGSLLPILTSGQGFVTTPGGLFAAVEERRLVFFDEGGEERGSYPLDPAEDVILGAADGGVRVTQPLSQHFGSGTTLEEEDTGERRIRLELRDPRGQVLLTHEVVTPLGVRAAAFGEEAFAVSREAPDWVVRRYGVAEAGTPVLRVRAEEARRRVGALEEMRVHASAAGVVLELRGSQRSLFAAGRREPVVYPTSFEPCGAAAVVLAFPRGDGLALVTNEDAVLTLDGEGREVRAAAVPSGFGVVPLEDGGLLAVTEEALVRLDREDREVARLPAPWRFGGRLRRAERYRAAFERGSGGEAWAELVLDGGLSTAEVLLASGSVDVRGALERLSRVRDGDPRAADARAAVVALLRLGSEPFVPAGDAPRWLRQAAALVQISRGEPTPWAVRELFLAIAGGEADELEALTHDALPTELAEVVLAADAARLDALDRAGAPAGASRFHLSAVRYAASILACLPGAGPARFEAAVTALAAPAFEARREEYGEPEPVTRLPDELTGVAGALAAVRGAPEPELAAAFQLLAPYYGFPIDPATFRRAVLPRRQALRLALASLASDRLLPARDWMALVADAVVAARAVSRDPAACWLLASATPAASGGAVDDPYCDTAVPLLFRSSLDRDPLRREVKSAWLASAGAPPELRIEDLIQRVGAGEAEPADHLALWAARELPWTARQRALWSDWGVLAGEWRRELAGSHSPAEGIELLGALRRSDPEAAELLAAERLEAGARFLRPGHAEAWLSALTPELVAARPRLREALQRQLDDAAAGAAAAPLLARAGVAAALPRAEEAVRTGCLRCAGEDELAAVFSPFGGEGAAALERLSREAVDDHSLAAVLAALYRLDAPRAEALGRAALAEALAGGCVPGRLLAVLAGHGTDPFVEVLARMRELGCDQAALRPERVLVGWEGPARALAVEHGQGATGDCGAWFRELFALEQPDAPPEPPRAVEEFVEVR